MNTPLVSIITVNYKQAQVTCELLNSIKNLSYPNLEVILVDNAQTGDDSLRYQQSLPMVKVLNVVKNTGFASGNNLGIKEAKGDYVFLLNNDTEIKNGTIETLLDCFTSAQIGAVSPVLRYYDAPNKIQFAGFTAINSITGRNELIHTKSETETTISSPYFHGAAVMIPKFVIDQCGLMPEKYFLYYEELDWSRMFREHGYEIRVCLAAEVLHKESISTGKNSPLTVYYKTRNRIHFMKGGQGSYLPFLSFFVLFSMPKNILTHLFKSEYKHLKAFCKGLWDGIILNKIGFQKV
jgi:GT2 family glycosyltransferase